MKAERITVGILAHVDAGKTTLAEAMLYTAGAIRSQGRVDHGDAYLDTYTLEKQRGITIFSKQAQLAFADTQVTLLDTPGHVDFSAEMERTLQVLDYALLVISGADGVQGHVMTLWRLLEQYKVPVFLFINKMDQPGTDPDLRMEELKARLGEGCVSFSTFRQEKQTTVGERGYALSDEAMEETALQDEQVTEAYLDGTMPTLYTLRRLISERKLFPCFFGSALHRQGVEELMQGMAALMEYPLYGDAFAARVFKIGRSGRDRLTYLKVTGGSLRTRQTIGEEKINQIRLYSGHTGQMISEARAGEVVAVTGLSHSFAGQGLGAEKGSNKPVLTPVLSYTMIWPEGTDLHKAYQQMKELEEEIPELHVTGGEDISVQVMGEVQMEILKSLVAERMGAEIGFDEGEIVYMETVTDTFEGVGHFEPLRHYAEVHLLMEPGERGSGLVFAADCPPDTLDTNWQNLVLTHLYERIYPGVLTGAAITDMKITLVAGRAHLKHTEGGDFREATYRAVRQGLMQARAAGACRLLEPFYRYVLEIPDRCVGRAMTDMQGMGGSFEGPDTKDGVSVLTGTAPAAAMRSYPQAVTAYSGGEGRISLQFDGYRPCAQEDAVIASVAYDPEADLENPAGSVFCSHGAGTYVPWEEVFDHMHLPAGMYGKEELLEEDGQLQTAQAASRRGKGLPADVGDDEELKAIFERTYGSIKQERSGWNRSHRTRRTDGAAAAGGGSGSRKVKDSLKPCLLVDGYNMIFAWDELSELAKTNLDSARMKLMDILSNYQGFRQMTLIVVFDAYKVSGGMGDDFKYHNIYVVYTKEAETADAYIEKTVHEMANKYDITVATSDGAEQTIIFGQGAKRMAAHELHEEIGRACKEIQSEYLSRQPGGKSYLFDNLDKDMSAMLEQVRLGQKREL